MGENGRTGRAVGQHRKTATPWDMQILLRSGGVPHHAYDPPARGVIHQLDAVLARFEWHAARAAARFIRAQNVGDIAERLCLAIGFAFPEVLDCKDRLDTPDVLFWAEEAHPRHARYSCHRHESRAVDVQTVEALPVARLTCRAGDYFVHCGDDGVQCGDIGRKTIRYRHSSLYRIFDLRGVSSLVWIR